MKTIQLFSLLILAMALTTSRAARAAGPSYHLLKEIPVGDPSSWDYLAVDDAGRRLYVSHGTEVVVIDVDKDAVVGTIPNTPRVHGIAPAPDLGRGVISDGGENKACIFDLKTLQPIVKLETGRNPDGLVYDPATHEAYLFNGGSASATVINVQDAKVVATIDLGGKPEFPTCDPAAARIYDNLEDKSAVVVLDAKAHNVVATWPLAPGEGPSGMAIDPAHHRLFIGCHNNLMMMMDSSDGKIVASVPIAGGVDANAFDPGTQLAFASCGDGSVTIAHEDSPDKLTVAQTLKTERGARTMTVDPTTHKLYLSVGQRGGAPNNFKVLVYEKMNQP